MCTVPRLLYGIPVYPHADLGDKTKWVDSAEAFVQLELQPRHHRYRHVLAPGRLEELDDVIQPALPGGLSASGADLQQYVMSVTHDTHTTDS